jgi:peptidoglycan hydrolase CwlO-like protein
VLAGATVLAALAPGLAAGDDINAKRAEAARISQDISARTQHILELDRQYRQAQSRLADAQRALGQAESGLRDAMRRTSEARRRLSAQAVAAYTRAGTLAMASPSARTGTDMGVYRSYLGVASGADLAVLEDLRVSRQDLDGKKADLSGAVARARVETAGMAVDRRGLEQAEQAQRDLLAHVNGQLASLVAAEQARKAALAQAQAAQLRAAAASAASAVRSSAGSPAAAPSRSRAPAAAPSAAGGSDPWTCIRQLESGNNYNSPGGGAYQFEDATWHSLGYTGSAQDYPPEVQDAAARRLQARDGWRPWTTAPLCGLL